MEDILKYFKSPSAINSIYATTNDLLSDQVNQTKDFVYMVHNGYWFIKDKLPEDITELECKESVYVVYNGYDAKDLNIEERIKLEYRLIHLETR